MIQKAPHHCVVWFGQPSVAERDCLSAAGWRVRSAGLTDSDGVGMRHGDIVVGVADLRRSTPEAYPAMQSLMADYAKLPWLVLLEDAGQARDPVVQRMLELGVSSFAEPLELQRLANTLEMLGECKDGASQPTVGGISGRSPAIRATIASILKYAPVELPVLITGETGTGKEVVARALHEQSARRERAFVAINCGALPPNLVQSELFGHERGAFTGANARQIGRFEAAAGGTVFLDEVGDLPPEAQISLLRLLQEGTLERVGSTQPIKVNVRVLAATHVDLERAVAQGRFREDLYYRLNVLRLRMPALRERGDDVELLAQEFLDHFRARHSCRARGFDRSARRAMREFTWPGNVRELEHVIERLTLLCPDGVATLEDLPKSLTSAAAHPAEIHFGGQVIPMRELQRRYVAWALQQLGGAKMATCERLGIDAKTLKRWLSIDGNDD